MKKELAKKEFKLDGFKRSYEKIINDRESGVAVTNEAFYDAQGALPGVIEDLRRVQCQLYGWRTVKNLYDKKEIDKLTALRRRVLDLENQEILFKQTLANYKGEAKLKEQAIRGLQSHLGSTRGFNPKPEDIQKAHEELLEIHQKAGIAEVGLPQVQADLKEARAELDKAEKEKKSFSKVAGNIYSSPNDEVDAKARAYSEERGLTYTAAVQAVMDEDDELAEAYLNYCQTDE